MTTQILSKPRREYGGNGDLLGLPVVDLARFPQFLIIGAIKAATTWVTWQLQRHPGIYLPDPEPHYFSREHHRGPEWYARHFADASPGQLRGEKTADYLGNPQAAGRIARVLPNIPLIVQLREPVARAYSDYCMLLRRGTICGRPEEYLDPATATFRRFIDNGRYFSHLERWFSLFDSKQFLIFLFDDVQAQPDKIIADCCRHLGVAPLEDHGPSGAGRVNDGSVAYLPLTIRRMLQPAKRLVRPLRGNVLFERARAMLAKPIEYPPLSPELRARLQDFYAPEVQALSSMLGRNLDHWLPGGR